MSDTDRLSALLLQQAELSVQREERQAELSAQQAELSAQREERLAGMLEQLMSRQLTPAVTGPGTEDPGSAAAARPTVRMPASSTPAPYLTSSASLRDFAVWKEKLDGYMMLTGASTLPVAGQRAALLSLLDEDWHRVIKYVLDVASDAPLATVVSGMEQHLRKQRNVLVH